MAIVCYLCKKEVDIISFGTGFVGVCCNRVLYNYAAKPQFDVKQEKKKDIPLDSFYLGTKSYQVKHS